jgi:hypothetical protein
LTDDGVLYPKIEIADVALTLDSKQIVVLK